MTAVAHPGFDWGGGGGAQFFLNLTWGRDMAAITAGTAVAMSLIVLVSDPTPHVKCSLVVSSPGGYLKVIVILVALQAYKDMHTQHRKI